MKTSLLFLMIGTGLLTGCLENGTTETVRTVDWYLAHKNEIFTKLAECDDNPGQLNKTPNCINAREAHSHTPLSDTKLLDEAKANLKKAKMAANK